MTRWTLRLEPEPTPDMRAQILVPLGQHNEEQAGPGLWRLFAITVRNAEDDVVGGLYARMGYGFMFVELLALGPARGEGLGRQVMAIAEAEARAAGMAGMWLDTWTFQAPDFYRKLGFEEFGRIGNYPPGHDRIFLLKRFTDEAGGGLVHLNRPPS